VAHFYSDSNPYDAPFIIKGVVFDNDNALYLEPQNAYEYHVSAAVEAVQEQLPELPDWKVRLMLLASKAKYGGSLDIFEKEHGADMPQLRKDQYARLIDNTNGTGFFNPDNTPGRGLTTLLSSGVQLGIATHGSKEWTFHSLRENQLAHMFNDTSIVTKEDVKHGKNVGPEMYDAILDAMGVPEADYGQERGIGYVMVEDTMVNLKFAKERGMTTILIDADRYDPDEIADYVDIVVKTNSDAVQAVIASNANFSVYAKIDSSVVAKDSVRNSDFVDGDESPDVSRIDLH